MNIYIYIYIDDSGVAGDFFAVIMGSNQTWLGNFNGGFYEDHRTEGKLSIMLT